MNILLAVLAIVFAIALCVLMVLHLDARKKLAHFRHIQDAETYRSSCEADANAALEKCRNLSAQANTLNERLTAHKHRVAQYQQLLGTFQSAAELHQRIERDTARTPTNGNAGKT